MAMEETRATTIGPETARALETLRRGDIFLWASPFPDEDPMQQYLLLEDPSEHDGDLDIQALGTGMAFPPVNRVKRSDPVIFLAHAPTPEETERPRTKKAKRK